MEQEITFNEIPAIPGTITGGWVLDPQYSVFVGNNVEDAADQRMSVSL